MTALTKRTPQIIAFEINSITDQTRKMVLNNSIEIGRKLKEAKSMVDHGKWADWLKSNVNYSQSTATNFMNIFEEFGTNQLVIFGDNSNSQTFANLSYSQAVALLGVPSEEREDFAKDNNIEDMTARELAQAIKDKKSLEKQLQDSQEEIETGRVDYNELAFKAKEQEATVNKLNEELKAAIASSENSTAKKLKEAIDKAKFDLAESVKKVKELETELKKKPIDVPATVEVVPEEMKTEIETLRKAQEDHTEQLRQAKLKTLEEAQEAYHAKLKETVEEAESKLAAMQTELEKNNNTEAIAVRTAVKNLSLYFNATMATINEVKSPEDKQKYKDNILIALDRLKAQVV